MPENLRFPSYVILTVAPFLMITICWGLVICEARNIILLKKKHLWKHYWYDAEWSIKDSFDFLNEMAAYKAE